MKQVGDIVLASESAARAKVLRNAGVAFGVQPSGIDENVAKGEDGPVDEIVLRLARQKALTVGSAGEWVIGADQLLVCDGERFNKSADVDEAREQLLRLRGREHELVTGCVCVRDNEVVWEDLARPRLWMRDFSEAFLDEYLAQQGDRVLSSVGAYQIEGPGIQLLDRIEGEHSAVLGLPLISLLRFLRSQGVLAT